MKKYTAEEMKRFEKDENGRLLCPAGDYTEIKSFPERCNFGERCSFGVGCSFGDNCRFGKDCRFGEGCSFSAGCRFGEECHFGAKCGFEDGGSFGAGCSFGAECRFGEYCRFGADCRFGEECRFGKRCSFGENCRFGAECRFEGGHIAAPGYPMLTFGGFGSANRTTYAFNCTDGIVIRCGCFSGSLEEFRKKVRERHGNTPFAIEYLAVADLIERRFSREGEVRR